MTDQEFFELVNGKRISHNSWSKNFYFIPDGIGSIPGSIVDRYCHLVLTGSYYINNEFKHHGFISVNPDVDIFYKDWSIVTDGIFRVADGVLTIKDKVKKTCTCSSYELFNFGCKCGGV